MTGVRDKPSIECLLVEAINHHDFVNEIGFFDLIDTLGLPSQTITLRPAWLDKESVEVEKSGFYRLSFLDKSLKKRMSSQSGKLMPNLDQQSTKVLNLTVLQRIDPFVEEILITAAHVTFYEFNIDLNQWSRKDVEGSLFNLLGDFEYEVQVPYLLYRNAAQEVNGIWFYNSRECEEVANLFSRILNAYSKVPSKPKVSSSKSSEFEELEAVPTLSLMEGPLEPSSSSVPIAADVPDDSFVNFFSTAMNMGNTSNAANAGQQHPSPAALPLSSRATGVIPSPIPPLRIPSPPLLLSSTPLLPLHDHTDSKTSGNHAANLVKPSSFFATPPTSSPLMIPTISSSAPTAPPLQPPVNLQRPYGTPMLQPFPPSTPPPSLTPNPTYGAVITRDKVRDALLRLSQNNNFIDMVYREILNAHYS
ncbi:hypothetical protein CKAN_01407700 [Cinnamomum micranthum f. kanehirae]|uniref:mRNA-decapping enzyme-like protein n=1 Tax=Cinnamomum micranthum f. kanehirae TaxID=337451 RepID=A0A3S3QJ56_9MAGN|nr:hypothetical protein CKAN_01407700 [Cinnamomum micranthum f. kanehirae]